MAKPSDFGPLTTKLCGRQPPHLKEIVMTENTTTDEQSRAAADCPNERIVSHDDEPWIEPEDCEHCGCEAGEFDDGDWECGAWKCPECGCVQ